MATYRSSDRLAYRASRWDRGKRALPEEVAIALVYDGTTQAVMMATPADLTDFGLGFSLTEGLIETPADIAEIAVLDHDTGIEIRMTLANEAGARFQERRRATIGPVGCGLCGIDSLAEALRPLPVLPQGGITLRPTDIADATAGLTRHQALHDVTRAAHAAAFYQMGEGLITAREDVGRHNALDKLAGALSQTDTSVSDGAVVLTSRVSIDMVQKTVMMGAPILIATSAPTVEAVRQANQAGLTLIAVAKGADFEVFTHPDRVDNGEDADVA